MNRGNSLRIVMPLWNSPSSEPSAEPSFVIILAIAILLLDWRPAPRHDCSLGTDDGITKGVSSSNGRPSVSSIRGLEALQGPVGNGAGPWEKNKEF